MTEEQLKAGNFDFTFDLEDTVYVQLHPLEVSMQQSEPPRLVDNQYLFSVSPTARRWYELVAPKIYGAVKHKKEFCQISYSWYVRHHHTLTRMTTRRRILMQMNKLARDHVQRGYIFKIEYRTVREPGKEIDVLIRYYPGPEAKASIERIRLRTSTRRTTSFTVPAYSDGEVADVEERFIEEAPVRKAPAQPDPPAHALTPELVKRGIARQQAEKLLQQVADDQAVVDQLEWADHVVSQGQITNPPGFYVYILRNNITVPADFETAQKRELREKGEQATDALRQRRLDLEERYRQYVQAETDRYIQTYVPEGEYERLIAAKKAELLQTEGNQNIPDRLLSLMATGAVRSRLKAGIVVATFEAFCAEQEAESSGPAEPAAATPLPSDSAADTPPPFVV